MKTLRRRLAQFFKFCIVGAANTTVYMSTYALLLFMHVYFLWAHAVGFGFSIVCAYLLNRRFIFPNGEGANIAQFGRTLLCYAATFLLNTGLLAFFVHIGISKLVAPILPAAVSIPLNFLLNKFWAFRPQRLDKGGEGHPITDHHPRV